jgi:hypothetical protein
MLFQLKKKPSPRLKRSALHIPSHKPWPKLFDPKPPPRPHSAPQCPKSPRRAFWSPSDAQRKPHALAMRCRPTGSVRVASASTQPFFSPLPKPWSAATPRPTPGSRCRSPQPGAKCPAPSRGRASPQPMAGPCPSLCFPACPTTLCSRPRPSPQRALKLGAAHALSRPSPSRSPLWW